MKPNLRSIPLHMMLLAGLLPCAAVAAETECAPDACEQPSAIATEAPVRTDSLAFLGVDTERVDAATRKRLKLPGETGLRVFVVSRGSPAFGTLQAGDVLCEMDSQILCNHAQLRTLVRAKNPGDSVRLKLFRDGEAMEVTLTLAKLRTDARGFREGSPVPGFFDDRIDFSAEGMLREARMRQLRSRGVPPYMDGYDIPGNFSDEELNVIREVFRHHREMLDKMRSQESPPQALRKNDTGRPNVGKCPPETNCAPTQGNTANATSQSFSSKAMLHDCDGTASLSVNNGLRILKIQDAQGKTTFEGAVDTAEQRKALPADAAKKLRELEQLLSGGANDNTEQPDAKPDAKPKAKGGEKML